MGKCRCCRRHTRCNAASSRNFYRYSRRPTQTKPVPRGTPALHLNGCGGLTRGPRSSSPPRRICGSRFSGAGTVCGANYGAAKTKPSGKARDKRTAPHRPASSAILPANGRGICVGNDRSLCDGNSRPIAFPAGEGPSLTPPASGRAFNGRADGMIETGRGADRFAEVKLIGGIVTCHQPTVPWQRRAPGSQACGFRAISGAK